MNNPVRFEVPALPGAVLAAEQAQLTIAPALAAVDLARFTIPAFELVERNQRLVAPFVAKVQSFAPVVAKVQSVASGVADYMRREDAETEAAIYAAARGAHGRTRTIARRGRGVLKTIRNSAQSRYRALTRGQLMPHLLASIGGSVAGVRFATTLASQDRSNLPDGDSDPPERPGSTGYQPAAVPTCLRATVSTLVAAPGAPSRRAAAAA